MGIALGVGGFGATSSVPGLVAIAIGAALLFGLLSVEFGRRLWDILLRGL
ncbi:hypothetical protein CKA32_002874 [Geitlerinema sp. FC II]|nr:hypothetical protein CKA32_002874 [Geitlerinema sp. FC II]